ncbi:Fic family protein [Clostridium sp. MT-14]|uniref:Fic family protein n=1 Tax=Clostridium aromativorans TaxID=2836848 RepID=A0ABS8N848_9CLOT|nr:MULTISPECIES: Fic family protein [Clostridium]KAA8667984.1 Fic family protein [Clostridium sp. HV4-5-A1G]MCC9294918.1 Fic family protein [Clostridium aromativorans]
MSYKDCIKIWRKGISEDLLDRFFLKFTYASNKIENNETRLRDVETIFKGEKVTDFKGDKKTLVEIENHRELCKNILELSKKYNSKLSIDLIKKVHYSLMKDCFSEKLLGKGEKPGEFKKGDYIVGLHDVGVAPEEVEENLDSLIKEINEVKIDEDNALVVVGYFHCWFETIHPFADGNGRTGRMLVNYLLMGNDFPPVVLFESDREEYYLALEYFNETQEISKMVNFLEDEAYKTWIKDYNVKLKDLKDFLD